MTDKQTRARETSESDRAPVGAPRNDAETLRQEIELRAYYRYCERGCVQGSDVKDWLAAEQEALAARATRTTPRDPVAADDSHRRGRRHRRATR